MFVGDYVFLLWHWEANLSEVVTFVSIFRGYFSSVTIFPACCMQHGYLFIYVFFIKVFSSATGHPSLEADVLKADSRQSTSECSDGFIRTARRPAPYHPCPLSTAACFRSSPYLATSSPPAHGGVHAACIFCYILCRSDVGRSNVICRHWHPVGAGNLVKPINL